LYSAAAHYRSNEPIVGRENSQIGHGCLEATAAMRAQRVMLATLPMMSAISSPAGKTSGDRCRLDHRCGDHGAGHNRQMPAPLQERVAYSGDPILGTDPQPNHAFYFTAMEIGGRAFEKAGQVWYKTLRALHQTSQFDQMANETEASALALYGPGSIAQKAVQKAWQGIGF
jgi:hypothetical protein